MLNIPDKFKERYEQILGDEAKHFFSYCELPLQKAFRINTIKADAKQVEERLKSKGWDISKLPWYELGYVVNEKPDNQMALGNTLEHFLGWFYIQNESSMIPPILLKPTSDDVVLDVAAAPGSKTTQMAAMMNNRGLIVANDINIGRLKALRFNLEKLGVVNTAVTRMDGRLINKKYVEFDKILLDAPCSAEGTVRKDFTVLNHWSEKLIAGIARMQRALADSAYQSLAQGGEMVYSTCTLAPEEDEGTVTHILDKFSDATLEKIKINNFKTRPGIEKFRDMEFSGEATKCARVWPQDNDTEGFFLAKIRKG